METILLIGIISVTGGAESWNDMEDYACAKEGFLRAFLELPNGIPSHDTFNGFFSNIESEKSQSLDTGGFITPLILNIINSTSYIIFEYELYGDIMFRCITKRGQNDIILR